MTCGALGGRLAVWLQLTGVLVLSIALVKGQSISFNGCQNYQSSPKFNATYVAKLTSEQEGYSMLLTSDRPRTSGCQRIIFHSNGSLFISYQNDYNEMRNFTSTYSVHEATFTEAGYITIDVPGGSLGTGLSGNIKLYFIVAEEDYFVVATCESLILIPINIELVHAFIPTSKLGVTLSQSLNSTISATAKLENVGPLREVNQACAANLRGAPNIYQIYTILVKLGILPPFPFRSDSGRVSQFYSAVPSSVLYPGYPYPPAYGVPVRSIAYGPAPSPAPSPAHGVPVGSVAYGPAPSLSQPIPIASQNPQYFYNPSSAPSDFQGFTYQNQGGNYLPVVPSKNQFPRVNSDTSAFGSQQSGVTYNSGVPYNMQTPERTNFDTPQHSGMYDMDGASLLFRPSAIRSDPSTFNSQPIGFNYDSSMLNVQSPQVSGDQAVMSAQSPGISYE